MELLHSRGIHIDKLNLGGYEKLYVINPSIVIIQHGHTECLRMFRLLVSMVVKKACSVTDDEIEIDLLLQAEKLNPIR